MNLCSTHSKHLLKKIITSFQYRHKIYKDGQRYFFWENVCISLYCEILLIKSYYEPIHQYCHLIHIPNRVYFWFWLNTFTHLLINVIKDTIIYSLDSSQSMYTFESYPLYLTSGKCIYTNYSVQSKVWWDQDVLIHVQQYCLKDPNTRWH